MSVKQVLKSGEEPKEGFIHFSMLKFGNIYMCPYRKTIYLCMSSPVCMNSHIDKWAINVAPVKETPRG